MFLLDQNNASAAAALNKLSPRRHLQIATAFIGENALFTFGNIRFNHSDALKERLILAGMKARISDTALHLVISPQFAAAACKNQDSFDKLLSATGLPPATATNRLTVQARNQTSSWYEAAETHIDAINLELKGRHHKGQAVTLRHSDTATDYLFPNIPAMQKFLIRVQPEQDQNVTRLRNKVEIEHRLG